MPDSTQQQLIYDLIDGQLSEDQVQRARQLMAEDADLAKLHESLQQQQTALRSLPKHSLDDAFADRVVAAAQSQGLFQATQSTAPSFTNSNNSWWAPVAAITALAAMLLVTLFVIPNFNSAPSVATLDNSEAMPEPPEDGIAKDEDKSEDPALESADDEVMKLARSMEKSTNERSKNSIRGGRLIGSEGASQSETLDDNAQSLAAPLEKANAKQTARRDTEPQMDSAPQAPAARSMGQSRSAPSPSAMRMQKSTATLENAEPESAQMNKAELPAKRALSSQVMVFSIAKDEQSLHQVNQMLTDNGIQAQLPATAQEPMERNNDQDKSQVGRNTFAFQVRATPKQMQAAVLALNSQTDVVAVDAMELANDQVANPQQDMQNNGLELRARNFKRQSTPGGAFGGQGGGGSGKGGGELAAGAGDQPQADYETNMADDENLREINEYFRLDSGDNQTEPQSYTLIFLLKDSLAAPSQPADANESDKQP